MTPVSSPEKRGPFKESVRTIFRGAMMDQNPNKPLRNQLPMIRIFGKDCEGSNSRCYFDAIPDAAAGEFHHLSLSESSKIEVSLTKRIWDIRSKKL